MTPQVDYPVPLKPWVALILFAISSTLVVGCTRSEVQGAKTVAEAESGVPRIGSGGPDELIAVERALRGVTQANRSALLATPNILTPQNSPELFRLHPELEEQMNGDSARYKQWLDEHPEVLEDATPDLYRVDRRLSERFADQSEFADFLVKSRIVERLDSRIAYDVAMRAEAVVLARVPNVNSLGDSEKEALFSKEIQRQIDETPKRGGVGFGYRSGKFVIKLDFRNVSTEQEFSPSDLHAAVLAGGAVVVATICVYRHYKLKQPVGNCYSPPASRTDVTKVPASQQVDLEDQSESHHVDLEHQPKSRQVDRGHQ